MTDIKWRQISQTEYNRIYMMLNERYALKKYYESKHDMCTVYEDTGQSMMTRERWFLYQVFSWGDDPGKWFVNDAVVKC